MNPMNEAWKLLKAREEEEEEPYVPVGHQVLGEGNLYDNAKKQRNALQQIQFAQDMAPPPNGQRGFSTEDIMRLRADQQKERNELASRLEARRGLAARRHMIQRRNKGPLTPRQERSLKRLEQSYQHEDGRRMF